MLSDPFSPSWRTRDFADWRTSQRRHTGRRAPSSAIFQAPNLEGHPMLNAGYHAVPPGMIATVVTSLEMLELPTLRPEAPDRNWRLDRLAVYAGRGLRNGILSVKQVANPCGQMTSQVPC